jgi:hypothetical protein
MDGLTHKIGGIVFRTETNVSLPLLSEKLFSQFAIPSTTPDVRQTICEVPLDGGGSIERLRRKVPRLPNWIDWPSEGNNCPILRSRQVCDRLATAANRREETVVRIDDHYVLMRDYALNRMEIFYSEQLAETIGGCLSDKPDSKVLANFRQIFSVFLPSFSAVLLHSAGVIRGNRAALFVAPGGGGKTTTARLANGNPVLSDDQVILRREGGSVTAHGTPLGAMGSGPCQAKVGAIFLLEKASRFQLGPISRAALVQWLWDEHRRFTFSLSKFLKKRVFETFCTACYGVPVYRMRFEKDIVDWAVVDAAMGDGYGQRL